MKTKLTTAFLLFIFALTGCKNIYYVGVINTPSELFSSEDKLYHDRGMVDIIPANEKVLIKEKRRKNSYYVVYKDHSGYIFNPSFSSYRKFNPQLDDSLYGYSTTKPKTKPNDATTGGSVSVKGYYRKDGTYVKPHTRSTPSRRH